MTPKFSLSIDDHVGLLKHRCLTVVANSIRILMGEGFHLIVNGYKDPLIDKILAWSSTRAYV